MLISLEICIILFTMALMHDMALSAFSWKLTAKLIFFQKTNLLDVILLYEKQKYDERCQVFMYMQKVMISSELFN